MPAKPGLVPHQPFAGLSALAAPDDNPALPSNLASQQFYKT
jgi:hypothetical protein